MADALVHFSENPAIRRFVPHVSATADDATPLVWAIDTDHADLYLFPRDCPRVCFTRDVATSMADENRFLGGSTARRVAAIEARWLPTVRSTELFRYTLPGAPFTLRDGSAGYWTSRDAVDPLDVEPVGDLLDALVAANVELRILPSLAGLRAAVIASSLDFSIIRWHNAQTGPDVGPIVPAPTLTDGLVVLDGFRPEDADAHLAREDDRRRGWQGG